MTFSKASKDKKRESIKPNYCLREFGGWDLQAQQTPSNDCSSAFCNRCDILRRQGYTKTTANQLGKILIR